MKNRLMATISVAAMVIFVVSCSNTTSTVDTADTGARDNAKQHMIDKMGADAYARMMDHGKAGDDAQATLTYIAQLCNGTTAGSTTNGSIGSSDNWNYYKFYGTVGSSVSITVNRTSCYMDPAFTLYSGLGTTTTGLGPVTGNSELTFITFQDDDITPVLDCGNWADPKLLSYSLPSTGWYTLAVYDYIGLTGGTPEYEIVTTGVTCDSDGDGVYDDEDDYPNSDDQATVTMDGCDSGVDNLYLGNGAYMMDLINDCRDNAANHGAFVSCLSALTNEWKEAGLITGSQKGSITSCGGNANWP